MITILAALVGMTVGATTALRRGGKTPDVLQYTAGYGIAFTLLGMLLTIIVDRNFLS